jgi:uncharacterized membrane protein YtjA (UPF0391 family)
MPPAPARAYAEQHRDGARRAPSHNFRAGRPNMLAYAIVFFIVALLAALFGFGGIAAGAAGIAKILFVLFIVLSLVSCVLGLRKRRRP